MIQQIAVIGLGKMGLPLARNIQNKGFEVWVNDINADFRAEAKSHGINAHDSLEGVVNAFAGRRTIWLMVPAGKIVEQLIQDLAPLLSKGDILIDGGNSNFQDTLRRHEELAAQGIEYLDCGTSGGVDGALHGVCTMIGGANDTFTFCEPLFKAISVENGYLHCGKGGSGHFTKMVHNGIEYGMMQAIGEGFEVMQKSDFDLDLEAVAKVWNHGSVIRSWLIELTQNAFSKDANLDQLKGVVNASGEGLWTVETALRNGISTPVIALSVLMRFRSQEEDTFTGKVVAALRNEFGGHAVVKG